MTVAKCHHCAATSPLRHAEDNPPGWARFVKSFGVTHRVTYACPKHINRLTKQAGGQA